MLDDKIILEPLVYNTFMTDATHIYLDLDVINNDQLANNDPPPLRFQETRTTPLISGDANDYF
jgi:hypothetical protein